MYRIKNGERLQARGRSSRYRLQVVLSVVSIITVLLAASPTYARTLDAVPVQTNQEADLLPGWGTEDPPPPEPEPDQGPEAPPADNPAPPADDPAPPADDPAPPADDPAPPADDPAPAVPGDGAEVDPEVDLAAEPGERPDRDPIKALPSEDPIEGLLSGGSYTIDFSAGDPAIYSPPIPFPGIGCPAGTGTNPISDAHHTNPSTLQADSVESLAPPDMALGQIVPFEIKISVSGTTSPEGGAIQFTAGWSTETTNGGSFGYDSSFEVLCAFVDTGDGGHDDPGGDATVASFTSATLGTEIQGTVLLTGLNDGDMVVVEAWLVLDDTFPTGTTGNVQSRLIGAETTGAGDTINTGNQTVPLLRVREFETADADISVTKSDFPDPVVPGDPLMYTIVVSNAGPAVANAIVVTDTLDPNTAYISAVGPTATCSELGGVVTCGVLPLAAGESATITITVAVDGGAPTAGTIEAGTCAVGDPGVDLCNSVSVTALSDDPDTSDNSDSEPTNVTSAAPAIAMVKLVDGLDLVDLSAPATVTYTYAVSNPGNVSLTGVTVVDDNGTPGVPGDDFSPTPDDVAPADTYNDGDTDLDGELDVGEIWTYTATRAFTQAEVDAGVSVVNIATADSVQTDPVTDDATVTFTQAPALEFDKELTGNADEDGSGDVTVGDTLTYSFTATNTGTASLTNVTIVDPLAGVSVLVCAPSQPAALLPGESLVCTATYVVTAADAAAGQVSNTAVADSDQTSPDPDTEVVPVPAPALELVKELTGNADEDGSGDVTVGDTLTYSFTATNTGTASLTNVTIVDPLAGVSVLVCAPSQPAALLPGESLVCTATYVVTAADAAAGQVSNTAVADSDQTSPDPDTEVVPVPEPALEFDKELTGNADEDGSGDVTVGDTLTFSFTATNTGTASLTNVTIVDPLVGVSVLVCTPSQPAALLPGESLVCTATYVVTAADVAAGQVSNTAVADSDQTSPDPDTEVVPVPEPALEFDKELTGNADEDGSGDVTVGDTLTYSFTATNTGTASLTNVTIVDPLAGVSVLVCTPSQPAALLPGESLVCTATYVVTAADAAVGQVSNTAVADSDQTSPDPDTEVVPVPAPALEFDKELTGNADEDGSGDVTVGDTLTFSFTATNTGTASLTNVTIVDPLVGVSVLVCTPSQPAALLPGESLVCTATYVVTAADVAAGQVSNTAVADSDQTSPDPDTEVVPVPEPALEFDKELTGNADEDGSGDVTVGDTLTFSFTATNTGTASLTNVTIVDPLVGVSVLVCTPSQPAALLPGESLVCTATYVVTAADVAAGQVSNTAVADSDQTSPDPDTEVVPVDPQIDLELVKEVDPDEAAVSDEVTFTITVTNQGPSDATGVEVTDTLPDGVTYLSHSGDGLFDPVTGVWVIGNLAAGASVSLDVVVTVDAAGLLTNVAEVTGADQDDSDSNPGDGEGDDWDDAPVAVTEVLAAEILPETGMDADGIGRAALLLVAVGVLMVVMGRRFLDRQRQIASPHLSSVP